MVTRVLDPNPGPSARVFRRGACAGLEHPIIDDEEEQDVERDSDVEDQFACGHGGPPFGA
jgi:hypothetical protein